MISLTGLTPKTWIERGDSLRGSAVQEAAEHLLMDIAKLESEKAEKAAKR